MPAVDTHDTTRAQETAHVVLTGIWAVDERITSWGMGKEEEEGRSAVQHAFMV